MTVFCAPQSHRDLEQTLPGARVERMLSRIHLELASAIRTQVQTKDIWSRWMVVHVFLVLLYPRQQHLPTMIFCRLLELLLVLVRNDLYLEKIKLSPFLFSEPNRYSLADFIYTLLFTTIPLRQIDALRPLKRHCAGLKDRRMSWIGSKCQTLFLSLIGALISAI